MNRWIWLLLAPYLVVKSSFTEHCEELGMERYQVRPSTICIYDEDVGRYYSLGTAEDLAEALNEAHERRTGKDRISMPVYTPTGSPVIYAPCSCKWDNGNLRDCVCD